MRLSSYFINESELVECIHTIPTFCYSAVNLYNRYGIVNLWVLCLDDLASKSRSIGPDYHLFRTISEMTLFGTFCAYLLILRFSMLLKHEIWVYSFKRSF